MENWKNKSQLENKKSQLEIIKDILSDTYLCKDQYHLKEKDENVLMSRKIVAHRINYELYKFDGGNMFPFFKKAEKDNDDNKPASGLRKMCDYILFTEEGKTLYALLIELKANTGHSPQKQLEAAKIFIDFIEASIKRIGLEIKINIRKISIIESKARKSGKRLTKPGGHLFPNEKTKIFDYQHPEDFLLKTLLY